MTKKRSVLLLADPLLPVPPVSYGGVERIVAMLVDGLISRGWEVTLLSHPESTSGRHRIPLPSMSPRAGGRAVNAAYATWTALSDRFDIIHSFAHYDLTALLWPFSPPLIQSFQAFPDPGAFSKRVRNIPRKNVWFTTCGRHMVKHFEIYAPTTAIHNGVQIQDFTFVSSVPDDAPLVFLGRIEPIKGTHHAIRIAKATGRKLIIAGNRSTDPQLDRYFIDEIEPHLSDTIQYIGTVNDAQKNQLLGSAAAFLMPIEWDEPFGIVMAEALACGTPVIGIDRGAVSEIVVDATIGQCCKDVEQMIAAVNNLKSFSRNACRTAAETYFSSDVIVEQYIRFYHSILSASSQKSPIRA